MERYKKNRKNVILRMKKRKGGKKPPKTMEELTKGFEEFARNNEIKDISKSAFEKVLKKAIKKKSPK